MPNPSALSEESERGLWQAWAGQRDPEARRQLIEHHLRFAHQLAAKLYGARQVAQLEFAEYRQFALVGLIEAVDRFDATRNIGFRTFAGHRINGAVLNGIEGSCEKQQQISARSQIRQERVESLRQGREADKGKDLFGELAQVAIGLALGCMLEDSGMYQPHEEQYTEHFYDRHALSELKEAMRRAVEVLPAQARSVIAYHYFQGLSFEEIARIMSLSKARISQVHKSALMQLRELQGGAGIDLRL